MVYASRVKPSLAYFWKYFLLQQQLEQRWAAPALAQKAVSLQLSLFSTQWLASIAQGKLTERGNTYARQYWMLTCTDARKGGTAHAGGYYTGVKAQSASRSLC